jgi:hypothetical protein
LIRGNLAGIPDIGLASAKLVFVACDKNLISGLLLSALARRKKPTQVWVECVDPEGIRGGFTPWTGNADLSMSGEDTHGSELHDQEQ